MVTVERLRELRGEWCAHLAGREAAGEEEEEQEEEEEIVQEEGQEGAVTG